MKRQFGVTQVLNERKRIRTEKLVFDGRAGIYAIINKFNGNKYVGQSVDLLKRKTEHLQSLRRKQHPNQHLQNSYNLYGEAAFTFAVLEYVKNYSELNDREQHWIDELRPEYNVVLDVKHWRVSLRTDAPEETYYKNGETFDRPMWHKWVYGGEKNPITCGR
ncbi:MAG: GIY-YIG nuclease family protein [Pelodictyon phaeoclathratiforme]